MSEKRWLERNVNIHHLIEVARPFMSRRQVWLWCWALVRVGRETRQQRVLPAYKMGRGRVNPPDEPQECFIRALSERVEDRCSDADWQAACDGLDGLGDLCPLNDAYIGQNRPFRLPLFLLTVRELFQPDLTDEAFWARFRTVAYTHEAVRLPGDRVATIREIVGNPFRPLLSRLPTIHPPRDCKFIDQDLACLGCGARPPRDGSCHVVTEQLQEARTRLLRPEWVTPDVQRLALQAYASQDFSSLPVLGDALEEAGCQSQPILDHLRGPNAHVRGCWVTDYLLWRS